MLALARVAKFYGDRLVFKNIDLAVEPGRALLVVGVNGAGKSTLLRVMAGLSRPSAGTVKADIDRREMAYLGHQTFLYGDATALENLRFWTGLYGLGLGEKALMEALSRVGLARFAGERAGHFSRGMAQRLNLARVFCIAPRLLFLDEPDTGLDEASKAALLAEIDRVRSDGRSVVWVSHHLERDLLRADSVLHLDRGRAAYLGPVAGFDRSVMAGPGDGTAAGSETGTAAGASAGTSSGASAGTSAGAGAGTSAGASAGAGAGAGAGTSAGASAGAGAGAGSC